MTDREYNTVIRVTANRPIHNYTLILNTEPLHVRQYCRTLTLAQGRILYELWEDTALLDRDPRVLGQFVPSHLAEEARNLSTLPRSSNTLTASSTSARAACVWRRIQIYRDCRPTAQPECDGQLQELEERSGKHAAFAPPARSLHSYARRVLVASTWSIAPHSTPLHFKDFTTL